MPLITDHRFHSDQRIGSDLLESADKNKPKCAVASGR
jgi:hypothetical protein